MSAQVEMVHLRDLGDWTGGNTPSKANATYWTNGIVPWVSPKDMKVDEITASEDRVSEAALKEGRVSLVPEGSVLLVTRSGILAHTLPVAVTKLPVTINQDLKALTPKSGISPKYVAHALRGASRRILKECSKHGTTVASIETNALLDFEIPMVDLDEQHRIVAEIDKQLSRLDEAVANLKRVKANLKHYKAAVLKTAVEGRLVPTEAELARREGRRYESSVELLHRILEVRRKSWTGRGKYEEAEQSATVPQFDLPEGWCTCGIDQLLPATKDGLKTGPFGSLLKKHEHRTNGVPVLGIENVGVMQFVRGNKVFITEEKAAHLREYDAQPGDVLVSRSGTVGEVCVVPSDVTSARISTNLLRVRLATGGMVPEFFVVLFNGSPFLLGQVAELCKGSTREFLNQNILRRLCFVLPPLAEQYRIVAEVDSRLSVVHEIEGELDATLRRAQGLRNGTLARAFSIDGGENTP